jgi:hypothetical protein
MASRAWRLIDIARSAAIGVIFLSAGVSKVLRPRGLRHTVAGYRVLPDGAVEPVARTLGPLEIATGALLGLAPVTGHGGAARALAGAELVLFNAAISAALLRGSRIPCGCGPIVGDHVIGPRTLVRNLVLTSLLMIPGTAVTSRSSDRACFRR